MTLKPEKPDCPENNSLNFQQFDKLFIQADRALRQGKYTEAIQTFEYLYQNTDAEYKQHFNIQRGLVKAYQHSDRLENAIALCKQMAISERTEIRIWGEKFLYQLVPDVAEAISNILPSLSVSNSSSKQPKEDLPFRAKTLKDFKSYCQKNLLPDLKEFEKKKTANSLDNFDYRYYCLGFSLSNHSGSFTSIYFKFRYILDFILTCF